MSTDNFEAQLVTLRPRLHRYCARMTGSAIHGEDMVQDTLVKALRARAEGAAEVNNLEGWLFRIAHNTSLDFLRECKRHNVVALTDDLEATPLPEPQLITIGFSTFLQLPELQRCAVILKDVLGHSIEEIAEVAQCSDAAAKSALQRGRAALRLLAQAPDDARLPLLSEPDRHKIATWVALFRSGDFDTLRSMLAEDVQLELVNRLHWAGREKIAPYFTRYATEPKWRYGLGAIEGQPAMLVYDNTGLMEKPSHFVLVDWSGDRIIAIRDFLYAPYVLESIDWVRLEG